MFALAFFVRPYEVSGEDEASLEAQLRHALDRGVSALPLPRRGVLETATLSEVLRLWYRDHAFAPFWLEGDQPSERALEALRLIEASSADGLEPEDYALSAIRQRWESECPQELAQLELLLTAAITQLSMDAQLGRRAPRRIDGGASMEDSISPPLISIGREVLWREDITQAVEERFPRHRQYRRMKAALADLRKIAAAGGWEPLAGKAPLKLGDTGPRVESLTRRLAITADLPERNTGNDEFDVEVAAAVKLFQLRHGLPATGEVHALTLAALNIPVEDRIRTLLINLERWRWLERDFSASKEVFVNIAGYELFGLHGPNILLRLPVIVGKAYHATPVFSSMIHAIEINPYWNVPDSIAKNEIMPKLAKNSSYLASNHMKFTRTNDRYAIRQDPGPWNALGSLKFIFPNSYSVYLHDTPNRNLFADQARAFSHGCIRVSRPSELASFLLDTPEDPWSTERVQLLIDSGKNQRVKLPEPVHIHITYRTAWVDLDGAIHFRPDVYKRDAKVAAVLFPG